MRPARPARAGFTMIEVLVTVAIIVILIAMIFPALNLIKRQQLKASTRHLMGQLQIGLNDYMKDYPILGLTADVTSSDWVESPWRFLGRNPKAMGKPVFIDLLPKQLAAGGSAGPWTPATQDDGDQILDTFTIADRSNRFRWFIVNGRAGAAGAYTYTDKIYVRSTVGSEKTTDDLVMRFTLENGQWTNLTYDQAMLDTPTPVW